MWSVLANESPQKLFGRLQIQIPQEEGITYGFESEPASNQSGDKISFFQTYSIAQMRNEKKKKELSHNCSDIGLSIIRERKCPRSLQVSKFSEDIIGVFFCNNITKNSMQNARDNLGSQVKAIHIPLFSLTHGKESNLLAPPSLQLY